MLAESKLHSAGKLVGLIGEEVDFSPILKQLNNPEQFEITGICSQNEFRTHTYNLNSELLTSNPFGLISKSDTLIIAKTDERSFNLMVESILNSKHIIIAKPWNLSLLEIDKLEKLSAEASVCVLPMFPFNNWNFLEKTATFASQPLQISVQYKSTLEQIPSEDELKSLLFSVLSSIFFLTNAGCRKSYLKSTRVIKNNLSLLNLWFDFDNGCSADINLNFISDLNVFDWDIYLKENILKVNMLNNKLLQNDLLNHRETLLINREGESEMFLNNLLLAISLREDRNWFNIQSGHLRKIINEYLNVTEKLF